MAATTNIGWCDATVNFWWGCTKVSAACDHCYAETWAKRLGKDLWGAGKDRWQIKGATALAFKLERRAVREGRRLKVFSNSMYDFFDSEVPDAWRDEAMAVIALTPHLDWLVLTKRPKVMREYIGGLWARREALGDLMAKIGGEDRVGWYAPESDGKRGWAGMCTPLPNLWLGVTAEDQKMADLRIPDLLATPAAKRFVSCEPLLGPVDVGKYLRGCYECAIECGYRSATPPPEEKCHWCGAVGSDFGEFCPACKRQGFGHVCPHCEANVVHRHPDTPCLDWVICGGESGKDARPMHPAWARALRDQCEAAQVPYFFKQWGAWLPWEPEHGPCWKAQNGLSEDRHVLFPANIDEDPNWDDGLWAIPGLRHFAFQRVGTKRAGNLLDGQRHEDFPESRREVGA